jgi:hypothetical protein
MQSLRALRGIGNTLMLIVGDSTTLMVKMSGLATANKQSCKVQAPHFFYKKCYTYFQVLIHLRGN